MTDYSKITALYSRLSVGDEDRDGGESNSIQNQKIFLENYARGQHLTNIRHYIDDDESGRFFDRSAYSRMMDDVENGKIGVCIMKDLVRPKCFLINWNLPFSYLPFSLIPYVIHKQILLQ